VLGAANLLGDGFSMAVGAYLSSKSEQEVFTEERRNTAEEIASAPEEEKESLIDFYQQQGYSEEDASHLAKIITRDPGRWVKTMMAEQHLLLPLRRKPFLEGLTTFLAFVAAGSIPLLVYIADFVFPFQMSGGTAFLVTIVMTALALLGLGATKVNITGRSPVRSALEMLAVGALAAGVAYSIGMLLKNLVGLSV
jgi:VIT1/CCC1 family predicted Fe2+/Mn2+ transporter